MISLQRSVGYCRLLTVQIRQISQCMSTVQDFSNTCKLRQQTSANTSSYRQSDKLHRCCDKLFISGQRRRQKDWGERGTKKKSLFSTMHPQISQEKIGELNCVPKFSQMRKFQLQILYS